MYVTSSPYLRLVAVMSFKEFWRTRDVMPSRKSSRKRRLLKAFPADSRCCATTKRAIFLQDYLTKQGEYEFPSISLAVPHAGNVLA